MTFGEWIRTQRIKKGWNQKELAEEAKINQAVLSQLERDKLSSVNSEMASTLERVFGHVPEGVILPSIHEKQERVKRLTRKEKFLQENLKLWMQ